MDTNDLQSSSHAWLFFVKVSFGIALVSMVGGILMMPGGPVIQGYFALCSLFLVSSTITLSKTMRDDHEAQRLFNRISEARTSRILQEYSE